MSRVVASMERRAGPKFGARSRAILAFVASLAGSSSVAQVPDCADRPRVLSEIENAGESDCNRNGIPDRCDLSGELYTLSTAFVAPLDRTSRALLLDANADEHLDIVYLRNLASGALALVTRFGDGEGAFERSAEKLVTGSWLAADGLALSTGDIDDDGEPDLAIFGRTLSGWSIAFALGDSERGFEIAHTHDGSPATSLSHGSFVDFDGDGDLDFAWFVRDFSGGPRSRIEWLHYDDGVPRVEAVSDFSADVRGAAWIDVDGDQRSDLVWTEIGASFVSVREPDGSFRTATSLPFAFQSATAADVDADGATDLVFARSALRVVTVAWNDGQGGFTERERTDISIPVGDVSQSQPFAFDVDRDGDVDIGAGIRHSCGLGSRQMWLATNHSDRDFAAIARAMGPPDPLRPAPLHIAVGDVNHDAIPDVVATGSRELGVYLGRIGPVSLDCNGDGVPDECDDRDCDADLIPDECELDSNGDGIPDDCGHDCDGNGVVDAFELANGEAEDCNDNGVPDACELDAADRDRDGRLDECEIADGDDRDCNANGVPDSADLAPSVRFRLTPTIDLETSARIMAFASADIEEDGWADVLVARRGSCCPEKPGQIELLSNVEGSFVNQGVVARTRPSINSLSAGDVDGDGRVDVLVGSTPCSTSAWRPLEILLGSEGGTFFGERREVPAPAEVIGTVLDDLDGDGDLDIAAAVRRTTDTRISFWWNDGGGRFQFGHELSTLGAPLLRAAEFDGDGILDLAVTGRAEQPFWVSLSSEKFRSLNAAPVLQASRFPAHAFGDVDGDGDTDAIAVSATTPNEGGLLRNNGDGTFDASPLAIASPAGIPVLGPVNADGEHQLAIFVSRSSSTRLTPAVLSGLDVRSTGPLYEIPGGLIGRPIVLDVDRDGQTEYVVGSNEGLAIVDSPRFGDWDGGRWLASVRSVQLQFESIDLDADGDLDLAAIYHGENARAASRGTDVLFNENGTFSQTDPFDRGLYTLAAGNVAGDARLDLVARDRERLVLRVGDGAEPLRFREPIVVSEDFLPSAAAVVDFDGDGQTEIVAASDRTRRIQTYLVREGRDEIQFTAGPSFALGTVATYVRTADFNADSVPDLAVYSFTPGQLIGQTVSIVSGRSDGSFGEFRQYVVQTPAHSLIAEDLDADGKVDVVVGGTDFTTIFPGLGNGRLAAALRIPGERSAATVAADFDGDELVDLGVLRRGRLRILRHASAWNFEPAASYRTSTGFASMVAADVDRDGDADLVATDNFTASIVLVENATRGSSVDTNADGVPDECDDGRPRFLRGDTNQSSGRNISDAIALLNRLFGDGGTSPCLDAADVNDDGSVDVADPIALLSHLFGHDWPRLPPPFDACGVDSTDDELDCRAFPGCEIQ